MLSDKQLQHRCLLGQGGLACRYLERDPKDYRQYNCIRRLSGKKRDADKKANKTLESLKRQGRTPAQHWEPCGDGGNCPGYLHLPTVLQGYDVAQNP